MHWSCDLLLQPLGHDHIQTHILLKRSMLLSLWKVLSNGRMNLEVVLWNLKCQISLRYVVRSSIFQKLVMWMIITFRLSVSLRWGVFGNWSPVLYVFTRKVNSKSGPTNWNILQKWSCRNLKEKWLQYCRWFLRFVHNCPHVLDFLFWWTIILSEWICKHNNSSGVLKTHTFFFFYEIITFPEDGVCCAV